MLFAEYNNALPLELAFSKAETSANNLFRTLAAWAIDSGICCMDLIRSVLKACLFGGNKRKSEMVIDHLTLSFGYSVVHSLVFSKRSNQFTKWRLSSRTERQKQNKDTK